MGRNESETVVRTGSGLTVSKIFTYIRMMKLWHLLPILAMVAIGCSAGNETAKTPEGEKPSTTQEFKVALITPGKVNDSGWNALAYDGLQAIKSDMSATVDNQEAAGPKAKEAMRAYAQKGYNLVFGHGYEYNEPGAEIAADFPDTVFVSSSGGKTAKNAGAFRFYLEQGFYLAGVMAAKMSKTGKIGSVAVIDVPSIASTIKAYEAGAKAANPKIVIIPPVFFGNEGDIAGAKKATESVLAQGADFIIHQANSAAQGVFDACKERGANAFGSNSDQNENPSGAVVASATIIAKPAFLALAKQVQEKKYEGAVSLFGMEQDAIDFVINPTFTAKVPPELVKELEQMKADIKSGKLVVPKAEF